MASKEEIAIEAVKLGVASHSIPPQRKIALGIYADVMDRRSLKHEFARYDQEAIRNILAAWEEIARVVLEGEC